MNLRQIVVASLLVASLPAAAEEPVPMDSSEVHVKRRVYPTFPPSAYGLGGSRCEARVVIDAEGLPISVEVDDSCPPALHRSTIEAFEKWTWWPPGRVVAITVGVTYKVPGASNEAKTDLFGEVAAAYEEIPLDVDGCVISLDLHANGSLSSLKTNTRARCLAVPSGDPTPSHAVLRATPEPVSCVVQLAATPTSAKKPTFADACPDKHQRHVRTMLRSWSWRTDPDRSKTPYVLTIRFLPPSPPSD